MNNFLKIVGPYLESDDFKTKVFANIKSENTDYKLWFEVEKEFEEFIIIEKLDAFLVAILPYAIKHEMDINIEGKISEQLYYQLSTYLIPMLCDKFRKRRIIIDTQVDNKKYNIGKAVGTGISCGVDSLYTIQKHSNRKEKEYNITHLTFFNAGASGQYGGQEARELYNKRMKFAKKFADDNNYKFVSVDTNMNEFLMMNHEKTHTFRSLACVLILQKLFSKYYYSSGLEFDETRIDEYDTACYDILNMQCLSTEDVSFYSTGMETSRLGKVKEVANYKPSYKTLNVCVFEDYNCGNCEKCIRTLLELDAIEKIDLYRNVIDVDKFRKNKNKHLILMLKKRREKNSFYIEVYNEYKKNKKIIPIFLRILSYIPNKDDFKKIIFQFLPKEKLKKVFKRKGYIKDGWLD